MNAQPASSHDVQRLSPAEQEYFQRELAAARAALDALAARIGQLEANRSKAGAQ